MSRCRYCRLIDRCPNPDANSSKRCLSFSPYNEATILVRNASLREQQVRQRKLASHLRLKGEAELKIKVDNT